MSSYYRNRLVSGEFSGEQPDGNEAPSSEDLPGRHAALDDLAEQRGYEWSRDDLTVAEKRAELGG